MSREVRRVPMDWKHPEGRSLLSGDYQSAADDWFAGLSKWREGLREDWGAKGSWKEHGEPKTVWAWVEWSGCQPRLEDYMPEFPEGSCVGWQMYETCSEGSPISPVMSTPEQLADWLYQNDASAFGSMTATAEQWLATIKAGWAISAMSSAETGLISGVAATTKFAK